MHVINSINGISRYINASCFHDVTWLIANCKVFCQKYETSANNRGDIQPSTQIVSPITNGIRANDYFRPVHAFNNWHHSALSAY